MTSTQSNSASQPQVDLPNIESEVVVAAAVAEERAHERFSLNTLPNDVLVSIWIHLDHPVALSHTNKRFYKLGQDTLWRAKWLMQRYERYLVIFEAIARPKIFTPALLERLLRLGAPLSRNLAQLLQLMWHAAVRNLVYERDESIRWGRISFPAYTALMKHAWALYGEGVNVELFQLDSWVFEDWKLTCEIAVEHGEFQENVDPELMDQVRRLFKDQAFMPLPIVIKEDADYNTCIWRSEDEGVVDAIIYDCEIATLALAAGYSLTPKRTQRIINGWFENYSGSQMRPMVELLKVNGTVNISRGFAERVFAKKRQRNGGKLPEDWQRKISLCTLLWRLNNKSALPFRLHEVIEEVPAPVSATKKQSKKQSNARKSLQKAD